MKKNISIDLTTFKMFPCPNQGQEHNPKHCEFYHSLQDKRRAIVSSSDLCIENCVEQACPMSHNRVEQLYFDKKFKTKYCQFYPYDLKSCPYGDYCSFGHSDQEMRIPLIHKNVQNQQFYKYIYKTVSCPFNNEHQRQHCVYWHNPQDRRRDTFVLKPIDCPFWNKFFDVKVYSAGGCPYNESCDFCHGWKELDFHPQIYRTRQCNEGLKCKFMNSNCPFWHNKLDKQQKKTDYKEKNLSRQGLISNSFSGSSKLSLESPFSESWSTDVDQKNEQDYNDFKQVWKNSLKELDKILFSKTNSKEFFFEL